MIASLSKILINILKLDSNFIVKFTRMGGIKLKMVNLANLISSLLI